MLKNEIIKKQVLAPQIKLLEVYAPHISRKASAGQFIILRVAEDGEGIRIKFRNYEKEKDCISSSKSPPQHGGISRCNSRL